MKAYLDILVYLISFLVFITLIYGQCRITTKSSRLFKRMVLYFTSFFPKDMAEEFIRISFLVIINITMIFFIYVNYNFSIENIFMELSIRNFVVILVAFVGFVEILFITTTVVNLLFLNKDINKIFKEIDWLKVKSKNFLYTGYIRPLVVAFFETILYFNIIFGTLIRVFDMPLKYSIFITVLFYCYSKFIITKGNEKKILMSIFALALSLSTLILINIVNSLLVGFLFMYVIITMIAFKDVKVRF